MLAYDGEQFFGWARQPGGLPTVEDTVRTAIAPLIGKMPALAVAGRTDRGVGATGQVVSFHTREPLEPSKIAWAIDRAAPGAVVTRAVEVVPRWFHAQFSARARRYVYLVDSDAAPGPIDRLLGALVGRRDFGAFARDTPPNKSTVRTLIDARVRSDGHRLRFDFAADAFLRRQIRVLTATALAAAAAGAPDDHLVQLAAAGDRRATANPLPPGGLFLTRVIY